MLGPGSSQHLGSSALCQPVSSGYFCHSQWRAEYLGGSTYHHPQNQPHGIPLVPQPLEKPPSLQLQGAHLSQGPFSLEQHSGPSPCESEFPMRFLWTSLGCSDELILSALRGTEGATKF